MKALIIILCLAYYAFGVCYLAGRLSTRKLLSEGSYIEILINILINAIYAVFWPFDLMMVIGCITTNKIDEIND